VENPPLGFDGHCGTVYARAVQVSSCGCVGLSQIDGGERGSDTTCTLVAPFARPQKPSCASVQAPSFVLRPETVLTGVTTAESLC
jgi:hypothetical protein